MAGKLKIVFINIGVLLMLLVLMEGGAYVALDLLGYEPGAGAVKIEEVLPKEVVDESEQFIASAQISEDWRAYDRSGGRKFQSYTMYGNAEWRSPTLNVDGRGVRLNGARNEDATAKKKGRTVEIWVFGSSSLFGTGTVADNDTLPAHLERVLNVRYPGFRVRVLNFGVAGYVLTQELLRFKFELRKGKPDVVVTFNGANDVIAAFIDSIETSPVVHDTLSYYWRFHNEKRFLNWPVLKEWGQAIFPYTSHGIEVVFFWIELRRARADVDAWKADMIARIKRQRRNLSSNIGREHKLFELNLQSFVHLAQNACVDVVLTHQPYVYASTKKLMRWEQSLIESSNLTDISEEQVSALDSVPAYLVGQKPALDRKEFRRSYLGHIAITEKIARRYGAGFVDGQKIVDRVDGPVYYDPVHLTALAHRVLADAIGDEILKTSAVFSDRPGKPPCGSAGLPGTE